MLERIAVHQTRLRVPGIGLDARGVALGARGLVLLPSLDRLVAFLAVYTEQQALGGLVDSMKLEVVRSKLGTREVALSFDAGSSDRMDRIAEVARLAGGFTFTGTSRHFVQYRDAAAPFGYDSKEVTATDAALALYHTTFSQTYDVERPLDLRALLLRLMPHPDPKTLVLGAEVWVLAEPGLGPAMLAYFTRSNVAAAAGVAEWPPESSFDDQPVRRWLFRITELPARMLSLVSRTPGILGFSPVTAGAAVELGYRHPISLEAVPVFDPNGLVLFRGRGEPPLEMTPLPALADVRSLQRANVSEYVAQPGAGSREAPNVGVPIRLAPDIEPPTTVAGLLVSREELPLLRRLAYLLGADVIKTTRLALTDHGAFVVRDEGIDILPIGTFFRRVHASVYVPSGFRVVPQVSPETLFLALGAPEDRAIFFSPNGSALAVATSAFVPLETALIEGHSWAPLQTQDLDTVFAEEVPTVWLDALGILPLRGVSSA